MVGSGVEVGGGWGLGMVVGAGMGGGMCVLLLLRRFL